MQCGCFCLLVLKQHYIILATLLGILFYYNLILVPSRNYALCTTIFIWMVYSHIKGGQTQVLFSPAIRDMNCAVLGGG